MSTIESVRADFGSWIALDRGRISNNLSFPASVTEIVLVGSKHNSVRVLKHNAWVDGLFRALRKCADNLEVLRIETPYETRDAAEETIALTKLRVFVGPEGLLDVLEFPNPLSVLWTSTCSKESTIRRWEVLWPTLAGTSPTALATSSLRMLRVGLWDTIALNLGWVLRSSPLLEELSFTSATTLTKMEYLLLGSNFQHSPLLTHVAVSKPPNTDPSIDGDPSGSDAREIVEAWRAWAPDLQTVLLSNRGRWWWKYDYEEDTHGWAFEYQDAACYISYPQLPKGVKERHVVLPVVDVFLDAACPIQVDPEGYDSPTTEVGMLGLESDSSDVGDSD
ncbi:hypothetical protein V5O48_007106 [Marasmius crinis-equi]|uniref:Uncharacterized protein n=1 Tax=Marasmius crinis-equi TaxID=585013 RepID=A0ABR3FHP0_9AGAR